MTPDPNMKELISAEQMLSQLRKDAIRAHRDLWRKLFVAERVSQAQLDRISEDVLDAIQAVERALTEVRIILKRERGRDCHTRDSDAVKAGFPR